MMAAIVHLCGCTFYAIFASGELQPWAEPSVEEQESWTHHASMKKPMSPKIQETAFVSCYTCIPFIIDTELSNPFKNQDGNQFTQINNAPTASYGATDQHVTNNPFVNPSTIVEEQVQPYATDTYLHGTAEDRTY